MVRSALSAKYPRRRVARAVMHQMSKVAFGALAKLSIVGLGMRTHAGVAAKMFRALADEGINIHSIGTSEIKISCLIESKYGELAMRVLHDAFDLKSGATTSEMDL